MPGVMLANLNSIEINLTEENENFSLIAHLQELGLYAKYREWIKQSKNEIKSFLILHRRQIKVQLPCTEDNLNDLFEEQEPLDLQAEQQKDSAISQALAWIKSDKIPDLKYGPTRLKKYAKQFDRLRLENDVLYKLFSKRDGVHHSSSILPTKSPLGGSYL